MFNGILFQTKKNLNIFNWFWTNNVNLLSKSSFYIFLRMNWWCFLSLLLVSFYWNLKFNKIPALQGNLSEHCIVQATLFIIYRFTLFDHHYHQQMSIFVVAEHIENPMEHETLTTINQVRKKCRNDKHEKLMNAIMQLPL